ncbi:MAG: hypothetical protein ACE5D8_05675 [Fidelibacterota bacterium]
MNKKSLSFIHSSGVIPVLVCFFFILGIHPVQAANTYVERNPRNEHQYLFWSPQLGDSTLKYVENQGGTFRVLWVYAFQPSRSARLSEVKLFDVTGDGRMDIVALSRSVMGLGPGDDPWLLVFPGTADSFSATPLTFSAPLADRERIRATGFDIVRHEERVWLVLAEGTPERRATTLQLDISNGVLSATTIRTFSSPFISSGYGPVYATALQSGEERFVLLFSAEANLLKTALFPFTGGNALDEKVLITPTGTHLIGPGLLRSDLNHDQTEEILIPFDNQTVMTLEWVDRTLELNPTDMNSPFLWPGNETTLSQALAGWQSPPVPAAEVPVPELETVATEDSLRWMVDFTDTLRLGDSLAYSPRTDTAASFYSFTWQAQPPRGVRFNPDAGNITWMPEKDQTGWHLFSFVYEEKMGEKLVSHDDEYGARLQLTPIVKTTTTRFAIVVLDTTAPDTAITFDSLAFVQAEPRMFSLIVTTPTELANNRYQFEGESPFGIMVHESNAIPGTDKKLVGHNIMADLNLVQRDASVTFRYFTPDTSLSHMTTLTIIHDFESNVMYMSVTPQMDTVPQSFSPESWDPHFYNYPEYFFEGFPATMKMDSAGQTLVFAFGESAAPQVLNASVMMLSPIQPNHWLSLYLKEGTLAEIRGEIKVKENLSQKVIVEMDLNGEFIPRLLTTRSEYADHPPSLPIPVTPIPLRLPEPPKDEELQEPPQKIDNIPAPTMTVPDSTAIMEPDSAATTLPAAKLPASDTLTVPEPSETALPDTVSTPADSTVSDTTGQR